MSSSDKSFWLPLDAGSDPDLRCRAEMYRATKRFHAIAHFEQTPATQALPNQTQNSKGYSRCLKRSMVEKNGELTPRKTGTANDGRAQGPSAREVAAGGGAGLGRLRSADRAAPPGDWHRAGGSAGEPDACGSMAFVIVLPCFCLKNKIPQKSGGFTKSD